MEERTLKLRDEKRKEFYKNHEQVTNWQKVLIYLDENKDKHFTDQIAYLIEIYNLTNKNK